ncbi:unnamed protein product, partial [Mesorhabditis spiculigera]
MRLLLLIWVLYSVPWCSYTAAEEDELQINEIFVEDEPRSRLLLVNGNMFFHAGLGKNITFRTAGGGSVFLHDTDISQLPELASYNETLNRLGIAEGMLNKLETDSSTLFRLWKLKLPLYDIWNKKLQNLTWDTMALKKLLRNLTSRELRYRRQTLKLNKLVREIYTNLLEDRCAKSPCQNGATCIPKYNGYVCICPSTFMGKDCETLQDLCELYGGTHAGCQNNATCNTTSVGMSCNCSSGFHGPLCQYKTSTCLKNTEICGPHGHCMEKESETEPKYKCLCDWGYELSSDTKNPTCVDIDECRTQPCHPGVKCVNLPGTFTCSGCPSGFRGTGQNCYDIDECSEGLYPCSRSPQVDCYNTYGGYKCGSCPEGESFTTAGVVCHCAAGYAGDGLGVEGCIRDNTTICAEANRCLNDGTCLPISDSEFQCKCKDGYIGKRCERPSPCRNNPCQNQGLCQPRGFTGFFCECKEGFYGTKCCGMHNKTSTGLLRYPADFRVRSARESCDFVIAPENLTENALNLFFTSFGKMGMGDRSGPTRCNETVGSLTLYDGVTDKDPLIAVFCGDSSTGPTAPNLHQKIRFTSTVGGLLRYSGAFGPIFNFGWRLDARRCGYRTNEEQGTIEMPDYEDETGCEWFITVPAGKIIEFTVPPVVMPTDDTRLCTVNSLEVFDGLLTLSRIMGVCESTNQTLVLRSTGPTITIAFRYFLQLKRNTASSTDTTTEAPKIYPGFRITYKAVEPDYSCGGVVKWDGKDEFRGKITSPNFPGMYFANLDCTWLLDGSIGQNETENQLTDDHMLKLEFPTFDVNGYWLLDFGSRDRSQRTDRLTPFSRPQFSLIPRSCTPDYLRIEDVVAGESKDYCLTHKLTKPLYMKGAKASIRFHSNEAGPGKGFEMLYSLVCEKVLYEKNGTVSPWNYPNRSPRPFKCTFVIPSEKKEAVRIKIRNVGLEVATTKQCFFNASTEDLDDYIEIGGGNPLNKNLNLRYYCPKYPFTPGSTLITSGGNPVEITYSTSGHEKNTGFLLEYEVFDVGCGGTYNGMAGTVKSPNFPEKYLPHMHCVYQITVGYQKIVRLSFDNFEVEVVPNDECSFDHVSVYDGDINGPLLGSFCGTVIPPTLLSSGYKMTIVFVSDRSVPATGFSARWSMADATKDCDRSYLAPAGEIVFNGTATRAFECQYHIAVAPGNRILLSLNQLSMPCTMGMLSMRNGANEQSAGFHSLYEENEVCDDHSFKELRSHGNRVYFKLKTNNPAVTSFNISYETLSGGCGGHVDGIQGTVAAPQFPLKDARSMDCQWTIAVAQGNRIRLALAMIDDLRSADQNGNCGIYAHNLLQISDNNGLLRRICKKEIGVAPIVSEGNTLNVRYKQYGGLHLGTLFGFLSHFTTVCTDVVHRSIIGALQSPGYPNEAYGNRQCSWTIIVPRGNRIELRFNRFILQPSNRWRSYGKECANDYLKFGDGEVASAEIKDPLGGVNVTNTISTFCETQTPLTVTSKNNTLHIEFNTKLETNLFSLNWRTLGCGGNLYNGQNVSVSKEDIDQNAEFIECQWMMETEPGKVINVIVHTLSIYRPADVECDPAGAKYSGLGFYSGRNNESGLAQRVLCDQLTNLTYVSHGNELFMRLQMPTKYIQSSGAQPFITFSTRFVEVNGTECGGSTILEQTEKAAFHSPGFPKSQEKGVWCEYFVEAPDGHSLVLRLDEYRPAGEKTSSLYLPREEQNFSCKADRGSPIFEMNGFLEIHGLYRTEDRATRVQERICNTVENPMLIRVPYPKAWIRWKSGDAQVSKSGEEKRHGFAVTAWSECGGRIVVGEKMKTLNIMDLEEDYCNLTFVPNWEAATRGVFVEIEDLFVRIGPNSNNMKPDENFETGSIQVQVDGGDWDLHRLDTRYVGAAGKEMKLDYRGNGEIKVNIERARGIFRERIHLNYVAGGTGKIHSITPSNKNLACGGIVRRPSGFILLPNIRASEFNCEWEIQNFPGGKTQLKLWELTLPPSDECAASYLEIRRGNSTGELQGRYCSRDTPLTLKGESFWVKLRYEFVAGDEYMNTAIDQTKNKLKLEFNRLPSYLMGPTTSQDIEYYNDPQISDDLGTRWWNVKAKPDQGFIIHFERLSIPAENPIDGLFISEVDDLGMRIEGPQLRFAGWARPVDTYIDYSSMMITFTAPLRAGFRLRWTPVPKRGANWTEPTNTTAIPGMLDFNCGGPKIMEETTGYLTSPGYPGAYSERLRCKWTFQKPLFYGMKMTIMDIDIETTTECRYDYLAITVPSTVPKRTGDELEAIPQSNRICKASERNRTLNFMYYPMMNVYFSSDESRGGRGFKLAYQLTCSSYDFIKSSFGVFDRVITSWGYPNPIPDSVCAKNIVLATNRRLKVEILDLDLREADAPDSDGRRCIDGLMISHRAISTMPDVVRKTEICGTVEKLANRTIILPIGRAYFLLRPGKTGPRGRGFKIRVSEYDETCTNDELRLDEANPSRILESPLFPRYSPHSLDCQWVIVAPNGRRVQFTLDPNHFDLITSNETCNEDFIEFFDGPTVFAKRIGRFCGTRPPSTIYSSGNSLLVRYRTDSYQSSLGWNATYEIATCGGSIVLREGEKYSLTSPNYPDQYPLKADCRWTVRAPNTHFVETSLEHIWVSWNKNCSSDYLAIRDGNATDPDLMPPVCTGIALSDSKKRSSTPMVTVDFHANNTQSRGTRMYCTSKKCGFELALSVSNISCGGTINDESGFITAPGYPGQLLPHVTCEWLFDAGIRFGYVLDFEFLDEAIHDGLPEHRLTNYLSDRYFCTNRTQFVSTADLISLKYSDTLVRDASRYDETIQLNEQYRPFRIKYTKVPEKMLHEDACMLELRRNSTIYISSRLETTTNPALRLRAGYCHLVIRRPKKKPAVQTISVEITDYRSTSPVHYAYCNDYTNFIEFLTPQNDPWPVNERLCNATFRLLGNETYVATFLNPEINVHIWVHKNLDDPLKHYFTRFNMTVSFQECGGFIREGQLDEEYTLSSPNYPNNYLPNSHCMWIFEAPEGQAVK